MKEFTPDHIRNLALIGHGGAGKTSIAEAMLFSAGSTTRLGRVEEGNTLSDYHPDEIERQISINASLLFCEWKSYKINILDTPGYTDFTGEVKASLRVADTAVVLLKAVEGAEVGTEIVWKYTTEYGNAAVFVVNKLDQENADFDRTLQQAREMISHDIVPVQFPLRAGLGFDSIVDVVRMKLLKFQPGGNGRYTETEIPEEAREKAQGMRQGLLELIAETDENLLNKYLEQGGLSDDELRQGLRNGIRSRKLFPLLCSASTLNVGVSALLDFIIEYAPAPVDRGYIMRYDLDAEHLNAGFWAGDDNAPQPAFYAYLVPRPAGCETAAIEPHYAGWVEAMGEWLMPYEEVRACPDPRQAILDFLGCVYRVATSMGGWDAAAHQYAQPPAPRRD